MDGVMNARTIKVSNNRPRPMVVPTWPSTIKSLNANEDMVAANTIPAAVTTPPVPAPRFSRTCLDTPQPPTRDDQTRNTLADWNV